MTQSALAGIDPLLAYLAAVNAATFALFALDRRRAMSRGRDGGGASGAFLGLLGLAGGAPGMLLALLLWARRVNKHNIAWWFSAFAGLLCWGAVCAWDWGLVRLDLEPGAMLRGWNPGRLEALAFYLLAVNGAAFGAFCVDKVWSMDPRGHGRIPEGALLGLALAGGSLGGIAASRVVRHKTDRREKWYFVYGMPLFIVLHAAMLAYTHLAGWL